MTGLTRRDGWAALLAAVLALVSMGRCVGADWAYDDYRFIDWKATARRNKLTSREYKLESDQNVFLAIDSGRLMTAEVDGLTQFDHALNTALLMAHVAARGGDRGEPRAIVPTRGRGRVDVGNLAERHLIP